MSALTNLFKSIAGAFAEQGASASQNAPDLVESAFDEIATFSKAADGMASTTTAATRFFMNPFAFDLEVMGFVIGPEAALVADAANTATIIIHTDDAADSAPASAIQVRTTIAAPGSNTWATDIAQRITQATVNAGTKGTMTAANLRLRPGANLFFEITKQGTGVVVPASSYRVLLRKR